jgi:hypothetical protein
MQILRQPAAELQRSPLRHRLERRLAGLHLERRDKFRQIDSLPVHRLGGGRCLLHERGILSGRTVHFRDGSRDFGNANRLLGTSYSDCDENCRNALCAGHKLVHLAAGGAGQFGPAEISTTESPISLWMSLAAAAEHCQCADLGCHDGTAAPFLARARFRLRRSRPRHCQPETCRPHAAGNRGLDRLRSPVVRLARLVLQQLAKCLDLTMRCRLQRSKAKRLSAEVVVHLLQLRCNCGDGNGKLSFPCRRPVR